MWLPRVKVSRVHMAGSPQVMVASPDAVTIARGAKRVSAAKVADIVKVADEAVVTARETTNRGQRGQGTGMSPLAERTREADPGERVASDCDPGSEVDQVAVLEEMQECGGADQSRSHPNGSAIHRHKTMEVRGARSGHLMFHQELSRSGDRMPVE